MRRWKRYFRNIGIWIDIGFNVVLFAGSPQEFVSSRIGRNTGLPGFRGWICRGAEMVVDAVLGEGHCKMSVVSQDLQRAEL